MASSLVPYNPFSHVSQNNLLKQKTDSILVRLPQWLTVKSKHLTYLQGTAMSHAIFETYSC